MSNPIGSALQSLSEHLRLVRSPGAFRSNEERLVPVKFVAPHQKIETTTPESRGDDAEESAPKQRP